MPRVVLGTWVADLNSSHSSDRQGALWANRAGRAMELEQMATDEKVLDRA
ncbi:hypothetical protein MITS9509_01064 [Synechococcus sp. MIT S9509]|nr:MULTISPECIES: hypothetical protein [unclassified Synechococcus]KZR87212.1 hypothetical protein MITS9504_00628 [Synechococcus sp. MIT S9504]KZR92615.1 hypothetical protein MITS9509_01064 [Synechococcus sp. MIT S9509]